MGQLAGRRALALIIAGQGFYTEMMLNAKPPPKSEIKQGVWTFIGPEAILKTIRLSDSIRSFPTTPSPLFALVSAVGVARITNPLEVITPPACIRKGAHGEPVQLVPIVE